VVHHPLAIFHTLLKNALPAPPIILEVCLIIIKIIFRRNALHGLRLEGEELLHIRPGDEGPEPLDEVCLPQVDIRMAF
jgi:hypothetical protein